MPPKPFKPYGVPPPLDIEEYKDSFEIWHQQWNIFLALSTINTALPQGDRPEYIANIFLSCLSNATLKAVLTMGLTATELKDADVIIGKLRERWNAGRNCHMWRQKFSSCVQRDSESSDSWLSDLRDLARKNEFEKDCCAACQNTRILGQVVFGVFDDEVRRKLLERGATLNLDRALTTLRTAEATRLQASTIKQGGAAPVHQLKTPAAKPPMGKPAIQHRDQQRGRPAARWHPPALLDGVCRPMHGPPCHFQLKEGAVLSAIRRSRPIAVPLMPRVKQELDSLEDQGIISKVPESTLWVHPIVIVPKDDGGIRICGDFTSLNHCIIRPTFDSPTPFQRG
ncbi:hypothetical protein DAPPUDRAFT_264306 [Daphnia pulex]|uniref:Uncharacterized protein n=1 Tax=Daphnia pulex TaxID=6669 RepID=E9HRB3_DAPPU|nr:hypothetical protein DAPPUDRAFT_264306 [Daphnia pulex]|eukprot:EFX65726.1 hypothetical protein DAPPUDRAFT_264306 [Daphnia pulex]